MSSTYYYYGTSASTESSMGANYVPPRNHTAPYIVNKPVTQGSFQSSSHGYANRVTTNPPAPTVIVLGPLGTEYTTVVTQPSWKPNQRLPEVTPKPHNITKKPQLPTTITHNISTVISGTSNNKIVSSSFITVNLKEGTSPKPSTLVDKGDHEGQSSAYTKKPATIWTTLASWDNKPNIHLKQNTTLIRPNKNYTVMNNLIFKEPDEDTKISTQLPCEEETSAPDVSNFPPVRHPNNSAISQQEKPTIVTTFNGTSPDPAEDEIPTPSLIEDDVLLTKVDSFVNTLVNSLHGDFDDLKDVVYSVKNVTVAPQTVTKKPKPATGPTKKPVPRPGQATTKAPAIKRPTTKPSTTKPSSARPSTVKKPVSVTTKSPVTTTKRPKPTKKPTLQTLATQPIVAENDEFFTTTITETFEEVSTIVPPSDFRAGRCSTS